MRFGVGWGSLVVLPRRESNDLVAIAAGDTQSLGVKADGSIAAYGDNYSGQ
jgi:hypothetical protein